jgi:2-keto-3-deoxy-6-phosphogluconate aldolase
MTFGDDRDLQGVFELVCPGALTPTEVLTAWEAGADAVKVFHAETSAAL